MKYYMPMTKNQILGKFKEDTYQLLTIEGDDFTQLKGLFKIGDKILESFDVTLIVSSNQHDFSTYYGLEILDSDFNKFPEIEQESITIAEEQGYDV